MNPMALLKIKPLFQKFCEDHPKLLMFLSAMGPAVDLDSVIEVKLITSEGKTMKTNIKVNENDLELFRELGKNMGKQ